MGGCLKVGGGGVGSGLSLEVEKHEHTTLHSKISIRALFFCS